MKEKILFITIFLPFPLDMGAKIKTYNTLQVLSKFFNIDLICFINSIRELRHTKEVEKKLGIRVECIYKKILLHRTPFLFIIQILKSIFSKYPYVVSKFSHFFMRRKIATEILQNKYKIIYIDHLQLFQYISYSILKNKEILVILDQHNFETEIIARRLAHTRNFIYKLFLKLERFKLAKYERKACSSADIVFAITERDRSKFWNITNGKCNCYVSPLFVEKRNKIYSPIGINNKIILFIGTLSWYPNVDGILWFYKNVFKRYNMQALGWVLMIVGNNPVPEITKINDNKFVRVIGYVNDVKPYIKKALVSIVPLRIGGGIRIKVLDLFSYGMPIISTSIGCEGIPIDDGKNIIIANTPEEFFDSLNLIYEDDVLRMNLSQNAFKLIKREYSFSSAKEKYSNLLVKYLY